MIRALLVLSFAGIMVPHAALGHEVAREMANAANHLWKTLDDDQKQTLQLEFDDALREDWQFVPMERKGLGIKAMKPHQRGLAMSLIQTVLSHKGFASTMQIMALEDVLRQMENNPKKRDPEKYHLFLFGTPGTESTWGWRIEGHHLSISVSLIKTDDGQEIAITPSFFGTNPAEVRSGPMTGTRVLGKLEDAARNLAKQLNVEQKKKAILDVKVPRDVILGPGKEAKPLVPSGISMADLDAAQKKMLHGLVVDYWKHYRSEVVSKEIAAFNASLEREIQFAWIGKLQPGKAHYFRIQGPTFVLEYDNTQNGANHAHLVYRDLKHDFGKDALKRH